jgi:hypothetical protein
MAESKSGPPPDTPPTMPGIDRRVHPRHVRDLLLLGLLPLLAMAGLAGPSTREERHTTAAIELAVEYPRITRVSRPVSIRFTVSNRRAEPISGVWISFPDGYLEGFSNRRAVPAPETAHHLQLNDIRQGRPQAAEMELHVLRPGLRRGVARIEVAPGDTVLIPLRTLILP